MALIPRDDQSEYEVTITTPEGYSLERTSKLFAELERPAQEAPGTRPPLHDDRPDHRRAGSVKGQGDVTRGTIYVRMIDLDERDYTQFDVMQRGPRDARATTPTSASASTTSPAVPGRPATADVPVNLAGPDLDELAEYADELIDRAARSKPGIVDLDTTLSLRKPEVQVVVDREAASDLGMPVEHDRRHAPASWSAAMPVSKFKDGDEQYDVWLRAEAGRPGRSPGDRRPADPPARRRPAWSSWRASPGCEERAGRPRSSASTASGSSTVLGNPEGIPTGRGRRRRGREILEAMDLPPRLLVHPHAARPRRWARPAYYFLIAFGLSIIFMYMILAAQFESWTAADRDPDGPAA